MVVENDLWVDDDYDKYLLDPQQNYHVSYMIEMSKLTIIRKPPASTSTTLALNYPLLNDIVGDIIAGEFIPPKNKVSSYDPQVLANALDTWESQLPIEMQHTALDGSNQLGAPYWASMLHVLYQYVYSVSMPTSILS